MKSSMMTLVFVAAAISGSAVAADRDARPGIDAAAAQRVRFSDLDLSRPNDARVLVTRLQAAARDVCERSRTRSASACMDAAVDRAISMLNRPRVTMVYQQTYLPPSPSFP